MTYDGETYDPIDGPRLTVWERIGWGFREAALVFGLMAICAVLDWLGLDGNGRPRRT
jgi:hypothetical protein